MVGRRQLREKVLQTLYALQKNSMAIDVLEKNMFKCIEDIYQLYVYQLNLLLEIQSVAQEKIRTSKEKKIPTQDDINPNTRFIDNPIFTMIEENQERKDFIAKHKELTWKNDNQYAQSILKRLVKEDFYRNYMSKPTVSFEEHKTFIIKLFTEYIAKNEALHEWFEEKNMSWADDFHISNAMMIKTLNFFKEERPINTLIKVFKDDEDRQFTRNLLRQCINHEEETTAIIKDKLQNWDLDRVAHLDFLILQMAFTEMKYFPATPTTVIINEYIELAKVFSTDKSKLFINGILDKFSKEINRA